MPGRTSCATFMIDEKKESKAKSKEKIALSNFSSGEKKREGCFRKD